MTTDRSAPLYYVLVQPEGRQEAERIDLTDRVLSFEYEDTEKKSDLLKLSVNNWDLSNFDDPVWKPGNILLVSWGYTGNMAPQRTCVIQKVTGGQTLTVEAQSKMVLMNKEMRSRTFDHKTRAQVVREVAAANGFAGEKVRIQETDVVHESIVQARATDAQFLKRLADAEGFEFYVDFEGLHWHERDMGQRPLRVLQWFLPPDVGDIVSFNVENDVFAKPGKVTLKARDPEAKKDIVETATIAETPRTVAQPVPELVDPQTGQITFGTNVASEVVAPTTEVTPAQVKREADGIFKRAQQTTVELSITMVGDPLIIAKSVLDVRGLGKRLSGLYYVKQANHRIDTSGYVLSLKTATDGTRGHSELLSEATGFGGGGAGGARAGALVKPGLVVTEEMLELCRQTLKTQVELISAAHQRGDAAEATRLDKEWQTIKSQCDALAAAKSAGSVSDGANKPADPGALQPVETVDPETGAVVVTYKNTVGR